VPSCRTEQAFHDLYTRIWNEMRDEVQVSYAQGLEG
jgi:hypothetical protein